MTATTQKVLDWSRFYIPDRKTKAKNIRGFEIGRTATPTGTRESFYVRHTVTASPVLFVEPHTYLAVASLSAAATQNNGYVFMWNPTSLLCTFSQGSLGTLVVANKPRKFKSVLADYTYTENLPYAYSDTELNNFIPITSQYLSNTYGVTYTYAGSTGNYSVASISDDNVEVLSKALAIIVRKNYIEEQMRRGLGIRFRGPLQSIDSVEQLKQYNEMTKKLEGDLVEKVGQGNLASGSSIDLYDETVVDN